MAVDIDLIRAYEDGAVYTHAQGATITLPVTASESLDVDFFEVGAVGEEGLTEAIAQNVTDYFLWQKGALGRRLRNQSVKTVKFAAAETSLNNLGLHYAGSVITSTTEGAAVEEKPPGTDIRTWVLHGIDGDREVRVVIPLGEIGERGDVVWSGGGPTVYEWTLSYYIGPDGTWAKRYYIDDDMATP